MRRSTPLFVLALLAACGESSPSTGAASTDPVYVVGSLVSGTDSSSFYVHVVRSLDVQTLDPSQAYEFPGQSDVWVLGGKVFVADGETPKVTRYSVDATATLVREAEVNFAAYGVASTAFWNAIWVNEQKAYMVDGQGAVVVWNPSTMMITGTMPLPPLSDNGVQRLRSASTDRGVIVAGNRMYQPYYWADDTFTDYAATSKIAIYDTDRDNLVGLLDAPCPGLDIATTDDSGNIYLSNWTGNVGLTLVDGATPPCAVKLPAGSEAIDAAWTLQWPQITDGREASAMRYSGAGHALLSVFHQERVSFDGSSDPFALVGSANWRIWRVDLATLAAAPIDGIDWNSGATYQSRIDDLTYVLVPTANYAHSLVYAVDGASAELRFQTNGWGVRLFKVR